MAPPEQPRLRLRVVGYGAAAWCLGFAGVSAWQVATGPIGQPAAPERVAADASGLAIMVVLTGLLKLAGAAVALATVRVRPGRPPRPRSADPRPAGRHSPPIRALG